MTHFMKPVFLDDGQRSALEAVLDRISIGDERSRRIFIIALDYELTDYDKQRQLGDGDHSGDGADETLDKIAAAADALSGMLRQLPESSFSRLSLQLSADDDYARQYNGRYLNALQDEIERVSAACESRAVKFHEAKIRRHLVGMIINIYRESFEREPLVDDRIRFVALLEEIFTLCGLDIGDGIESLIEASQK